MAICPGKLESQWCILLGHKTSEPNKITIHFMPISIHPGMKFIDIHNKTLLLIDVSLY